MNSVSNKIVSLEQGKAKSEETVVICHGHFNIIHPGHIRYLNYARELGTRLLVLVQGDMLSQKTEGKYHFSEAERAAGVAALQSVDQVIILGERTLKEAISLLKPSFFVLGKEFEHKQTNQVSDAVDQLQEQGGEVHYHAGESHYASNELLHDNQLDILEQRHRHFRQACERQGFHVEELLENLEKFKDASMLIIGDTIVDQYVACDAIGMSAEAPVIVARELETRDYVGGAAVIALHTRTLGAKCNYLSVVGRDQNAAFVRDELNSKNVDHVLVEDTSRPTTLKIRYMVEQQKMFRVSRLKEHNVPKAVEDQIITEIRNKAPYVSGIVVSDFVYGVITPRVLEVIGEMNSRHNLLVFGDLQCSSQVGNVSKFKDFHLLSTTEREARIALGTHDEGVEWVSNALINKTGAKNLIMKLGSEGFIAYSKESDGFINSQNFPALNPVPIDVVGAGDSLLAVLAVGLCSGIPLMLSSAIGACMAALAVQNVGNNSVSLYRLQNHLYQMKLDPTLIHT